MARNPGGDRGASGSTKQRRVIAEFIREVRCGLANANFKHLFLRESKGMKDLTAKYAQYAKADLQEATEGTKRTYRKWKNGPRAYVIGYF